ncbi:MAG: hypothetical protein QW570_08875 [Candidatus Caldarchaeum sp.]
MSIQELAVKPDWVEKERGERCPFCHFPWDNVWVVGIVLEISNNMSNFKSSTVLRECQNCRSRWFDDTLCEVEKLAIVPPTNTMTVSQFLSNYGVKTE